MSTDKSVRHTAQLSRRVYCNMYIHTIVYTLKYTIVYYVVHCKTRILPLYTMNDVFRTAYTQLRIHL